MITIFYFDDDIGDARMVEKSLDPFFRHFKSVFGLKAGIFLLEGYTDEKMKFLPQLIITEAKFSDGSGVDIVRFVTSSSLLRHIPIVVYTNTDDEETKRACLIAGAAKIFPKGPGTKGAEALAAYVATLHDGKN